MSKQQTKRTVEEVRQTIKDEILGRFGMMELDDFARAENIIDVIMNNLIVSFLQAHKGDIEEKTIKGLSV